MIVLKRFLLINSENNSNIQGVIKLENFSKATRIELKLSQMKKFDLLLNFNGEYVFLTMANKEIYSFEKEVDISNLIQAIILEENNLVASGATTIDKAYKKELLNKYLEEKVNKEPEEEKEEVVEDVTNEEIVEEEIKEPEIKEEIKEPMFYKKIEGKLKELFKMHEKNSLLEEKIENSKWVSIQIPNDSFYVVGVIYEEDKPVLICYGIPDKDDTNPPINGEGKMQWLQLEEGGFWMMYQSAIDGQCLQS